MYSKSCSSTTAINFRKKIIASKTNPASVNHSSLIPHLSSPTTGNHWSILCLQICLFWTFHIKPVMLVWSSGPGLFPLACLQGSSSWCVIVLHCLFFFFLAVLGLPCSPQPSLVAGLSLSGTLIPWPGIEPMFPALEGGFWATGPPGSPNLSAFYGWITLHCVEIPQLVSPFISW